MEETRKSTVIRDLIIKIFLILLFVFLITILFPMPNLTAFYDSVFNNNVQSMKDAADSYFTKDRMPEKVGDTVKLTLQDMLDKKLILPFLDKDGNECDTKKSYVKVTKEEKEYKLEVHLSCPNKEDYIIEPIGCYNFCPEQTVNCNCSCSGAQEEQPTTSDDGKVTVNKTNPTPSNNNDVGKYKLQYLYTRTLTDINWNTGNYQSNKEDENDNVRLVDTKKQYTGQKKVSAGSTQYKHIKYAYKDNWSVVTDWTDEVKPITDKFKLYATRTLYTGYKKVTKDVMNYKHIKYGYRDNWVIDTGWTYDVIPETTKIKLYATRTLYTGYKPYVEEITKYKHVKYANKDTWTETGWSTTKRTENSNTKLVDTRYTVRKTVKTTKGSWSDWIKEGVWRDSKPADSSTKQWYGPYNEKTTSSWKTIYDSWSSTQKMNPVSGNRRYEFLYSQADPCTDACNGNSTVMRYYYRVYELQESKQYMYYYRTYSETSSTSTDEKVVSNPKSYTDNGYTIVKTEYKYKIKSSDNEIVDTKWTNSKTSPSGYVYANEKKVTKTTKYKALDKWVTSKEKLGNYTSYVKTKKQYKYKRNNPEKYVIGTIWTTSKTSPSGYEYTGEYTKTTKTTYEPYNKWVTNKDKLGEYTYYITTKTQYKYKQNNPEKYIKSTIWTDSINPPAGYTYTGEYKTNSSTSYVDLGYWVDDIKDLGEYTHNVKTRKLYRYKYRTVITKTESRWFDSNPGGDWVYANQTRKVRVN